MHHAAKRAETFLQRECGDPQLRVKWDSRIERFVVGRLVSSLASDHIEWFYVVTDGDSNYRPIDMRTVRKVMSLDTWRRKRLTESDFVKQLEERKLERDTARSEFLRYKLKHEARYIKKAAEKDGII